MSLLKPWVEYTAGRAVRHVDVENVVGALTTVTATPYSASITVDASVQQFCFITATDTSAFTINAPTSPKAGQTLVFEILNSSGGSLGTITWNAIFKLAGAFNNPASTKARTISFFYNGSAWVETSRAAADI